MIKENENHDRDHPHDLCGQHHILWENNCIKANKIHFCILNIQIRTKKEAWKYIVEEKKICIALSRDCDSV